MKKFKNYFELNKPYEFDPTDLSALVFLLCAVFGIFSSINITPLFLLGSAIGTFFCWKARRLNLIVLNLSMFVLNLVSFIRMF